MPKSLIGKGAALAALLLAAALPAGAGESVVLEPCSICHDELAGQFAVNPHLTAAPPGANPCESCHGEGARHAEEGDPDLIRVPAGVEAAETCVACHGSNDNGGFRSAAHAAGGVGCGNCHAIHQERPVRALTAKPVGELCASCHPVQQGEFRKPFAHKLGRGDMACVSCHNPHGGRGQRSLREGATGEGPCVSCHTDKRGPFVFPHVGDIAGDCTTCHEPHAGNNPKRLIRSTVRQLCLECHSTLSAGTVGSQPPSFHDLHSPRYRECTVCHVAVHGSNTSPVLLK